MPKTTIEQADVAGKRVLIRVDFNVPMDGGSVRDSRRIRAAVPTIKSVLDRGGSVVLMSHLGRPKGEGFELGLSLKPVAEHLGAMLNQSVEFPSSGCVDSSAAEAVGKLQPGGVLLLENLRFHKGEKAGDADFAQQLAAYGDLYCNDAFGTCHRSGASMVAVPLAMEGKPRVAGLLVTTELQYLSDAMKDPPTPFTAILGGAKVSDKINAVETFLKRADHLLIGGAMAYTFLQAMGKNVGKSRVERDQLSKAKEFIELASIEKCDLHLPIDHVCSTQFAQSSGEIIVCGGAIPADSMGLDIGPETQAKYAHVITASKMVVWAGPMGVFEWKPFCVGTQEIVHAMVEATESGAVTIVGGGDTAAAVEAFGAGDQVSHVSTGGGASLALLSGDPMPAVDLLDEA